MQQKPLSEIGPYLLNFIKKKSTLSVQKVAEETLGLHTSNFSGRLSRNNLKLEEVETITNYLGLSLEIKIGEMTTSTEVSKEPNLAQYAIMAERVIKLLDENSKLKDQLRQ